MAILSEEIDRLVAEIGSDGLETQRPLLAHLVRDRADEEAMDRLGNDPDRSEESLRAQWADEAEDVIAEAPEAQVAWLMEHGMRRDALRQSLSPDTPEP